MSIIWTLIYCWSRKVHPQWTNLKMPPPSVFCGYLKIQTPANFNLLGLVSSGPTHGDSHGDHHGDNIPAGISQRESLQWYFYHCSDTFITVVIFEGSQIACQSFTICYIIFIEVWRTIKTRWLLQRLLHYGTAVIGQANIDGWPKIGCNIPDTRRLPSDWLEPKNHHGDHGLNEYSHSDHDHHGDRRGDRGGHRGDHRQYDTLGFNATGSTRGDHRGDGSSWVGPLL